MIDFVIIILTILGFIFPAFLINAIRSNNDEEVSKYKILSCISFAIIVCFMAMLINS